MSQTIWIHQLTDVKKAEADGMDYTCFRRLRRLASSPR